MIKRLVEEWVSPKYHTPTAAQTRSYKNATPYPHAALINFLRPAKATQLAKALHRQTFTHKESDLFSLQQTMDLTTCNDPVIQSFAAMVESKEFAAFMRGFTGVRLHAGAYDLFGAIYGDTDYLLCHDDQVEGRKIAYVLNLSKGFNAKTGGALALLDHDKKGKPTKITKRLIPTWNTLAFFTVNSISHHQVEEVLVNKPRLTVGGWLHG